MDKVAPKLIATSPESLGVYPNWDRPVEFVFSKVISEGSSPNMGLGTGDLEKLILLSPTKGVPKIKWKRERITIEPREGWKPNRVYRLQLLPGIQDLRRNKLDTAVVLTFSTGGAIPSDTISGLLIDWVQDKVARAGLVELVHTEDSLVYRTLTDSGGRFRIGPLPKGPWLVYGAIDQNHNLQRERRESYDSVLIGDSDHVAPPLWLIPRDTVGPRIQSINQADSVSAVISFTQPLDPGQRYDSLEILFTLQKDSSRVPFRSLLPKPVDDSLQKIAAARADSIRRAADTTRKDTTQAKPPAPLPPLPAERPRRGAKPPKVDAEADSIIKTRPVLFDKLVLRVDSAFPTETRYVLEIHGIRSAAGVAGEARSGFVTAKPKPPPKARTDSTQADSTKAKLPHGQPAPADTAAPPAPKPVRVKPS